MPFKITAIYAGLNGIILLVLAIRVARQRGIAKVGLGTGGDAALSPASACERQASTRLDLAVDVMLEAEAGDAEHHLRFQRRIVLKRAGSKRLAHRELDLALRGDPHHLQEFAYFHVEGVFVHGVFSCVLERAGCRPSWHRLPGSAIV